MITSPPESAVPPGRSDPQLTRRALEHVQAGTTDLAPSVMAVPLSYYRDHELFERELQLLHRTPLVGAASCQLPGPHDYLVRDLIGTSVLVVRGGDGRARAFLNYCRHRGASPAHGCGTTRRFTCPYHAWVYDSSGRLVGIPGARGFEDLDRSQSGLVELSCEERHGLIWVVLLAGAGIDLDRHLGPLAPELAAWNLDRYQPFASRQFDSEVSWKAALEAFAESYHFPYVHGASIIGQNTTPDVAVHDRFGPHQRICFPYRWIGQAAGSSMEPIDHMAIIYWLFPNLVLAFSQVGVELIDILPAGGPRACSVRHSWMASVPATTEEERTGYHELFEAVHAALRDEDFGMLPQCGQGIQRGQHGHMVIGRNEIGVQHLIRTLAQAGGFDLQTPSRP